MVDIDFFRLGSLPGLRFQTWTICADILRTSMDTDMDTRYGCALPPAFPVSHAEVRYVPKSCEKLDQASGIRLKALMDEVTQGVKFSKITFWSIAVLWIMDECGDIHFAVEEVVDSRGNLAFPLPFQVDIPFGKSKLGHPALVRGANARIAGEIYFDMNASPATWTISNKSGRYGLRKTTVLSHLENVAKIFNGYGIPMDVEFITGRMP